MDNKICKTVGQLANYTDYSELISESVMLNIDSYLQDGTFISAKLRENNDNTLSLYTMILVEDGTTNLFRVMEHLIDERTFSVLHHKFMNKVSVHGCDVCSSRYRVDLLVDVIEYMTENGYDSGRIINCDLGPEGDVYVSYRREQDGEVSNATTTLYLKFNGQKLFKVFETELEDPDFILHGVVECDNGDKMLIHSEKRQLFDISNPGCDECVDCVFILVDKDMMIKDVINTQLNQTELVRILSCPKIKGFVVGEDKMDQQKSEKVKSPIDLEKIGASVESFAMQANEMLEQQVEEMEEVVEENIEDIENKISELPFVDQENNGEQNDFFL